MQRKRQQYAHNAMQLHTRPLRARALCGLRTGVEVETGDHWRLDFGCWNVECDLQLTTTFSALWRRSARSKIKGGSTSDEGVRVLILFLIIAHQGAYIRHLVAHIAVKVDLGVIE